MKKSTFFITLLIAIFLSLFHPHTHAQTVHHELGVRLKGLDFGSFGFIYKKQKAENKFRRYRFVVANFFFQNDKSRKLSNAYLSFAIGTEKRKQITQKLHFVHGLEPFLTLGTVSSEHFSQQINNTTYRINPGIGYILGFQYDISDNFYANIEAIPTISGTIIMNDKGHRELISVNAGFATTAIALSLVYRFEKEKRSK